MKKSATALLAAGLRGDGSGLEEAATKFLQLQGQRESYRTALSDHLRRTWRKDALVVTCSLSRTKTRDAVYTLIVSGSGRTYSLVVPQGSREAYDLQLLPQVGDKAQIELTAVDDG